MSEEADRLRLILEKVVAELHDASQTSERLNMIRVAPLLVIIGDAVDCPDCLAWAKEAKETKEREEEQIDKDIIEVTARVAESDYEELLDERLRQRPTHEEQTDDHGV